MESRATDAHQCHSPMQWAAGTSAQGPGVCCPRGSLQSPRGTTHHLSRTTAPHGGVMETAPEYNVQGLSHVHDTFRA